MRRSVDLHQGSATFSLRLATCPLGKSLTRTFHLATSSSHVHHQHRNHYKIPPLPAVVAITSAPAAMFLAGLLCLAAQAEALRTSLPIRELRKQVSCSAPASPHPSAYRPPDSLSA